MTEILHKQLLLLTLTEITAYRKRVTAENFDVAIEAGSFSLSSVVIETIFMARVKIPYWTIPVPDAVVQAFDWIWRTISEIAEKYTVYDEVGVFTQNQSVEGSRVNLGQ